jgi:hypothetical protein
LKLSGDFGFEESPNLAFLQALFFQRVHKLVDQLLRVPHLFGPGLAAAAGDDEGSEPMPYLEHAFLLQLAIDLDDCVGVDDKSFGQTPNARQLIAVSQSAGFDGMANLFLELNVDRNAGRRIGFAKQCAT